MFKKRNMKDSSKVQGIEATWQRAFGSDRYNSRSRAQLLYFKKDESSVRMSLFLIFPISFKIRHTYAKNSFIFPKQQAHMKTFSQNAFVFELLTLFFFLMERLRLFLSIYLMRFCKGASLLF